MIGGATHTHEQFTCIFSAEENWARLAYTIHRLFQLRRLWSELGRHLQRYSSLRDSRDSRDKRRDSHGQGQVHAGHQRDAQSAH